MFFIYNLKKNTKKNRKINKIKIKSNKYDKHTYRVLSDREMVGLSVISFFISLFVSYITNRIYDFELILCSSRKSTICVFHVYIISTNARICFQFYMIERPMDCKLYSFFFSLHHVHICVQSI